MAVNQLVIPSVYAGSQVGIGRAPARSLHLVEHQPVETTLYSLSDRPPTLGERRDGDRYLTLFRVGSLHIGERTELCLIKNISGGGMLIRTHGPIAPETRLSVDLKHGESVSGTARWSEGDTVGVTFDTPVDVVGLLAATMDGPRPRMPRVEVGCVASIRDGATVHRVQVRDISQGGLKIETEAALTIGSEVMVMLAGLSPLPAAVRWMDKGCCGIAFNRVIPFAELIAWLHEQRERIESAA